MKFRNLLTAEYIASENNTTGEYRIMGKQTFAQLKASARKNLLGHYSTVIAALLITELILFLINMPFSKMIREGATYMVPSRMLFGIVGIFFVSLVGVLLGAGTTHIHLKIGRGQEANLSDLLYPFKNRPDRYIGYGALIFAIFVLTMLPGSICMGIASAMPDTGSLYIVLTIVAIALMIAGGIVDLIIVLSWALTIFLLLDHSELRVREAMRQSSRLMRGNRWRMFLLYLSFVGWLLLSILSFFIGLLWIMPYLTQTLVSFYFEVKTGDGVNVI